MDPNDTKEVGVTDGQEYSSEALAGDTDEDSNPPKEADNSEGNDENLFADLVADEDYADEEITPEPKKEEEPAKEEPKPETSPEPKKEEQPQVSEPASQPTTQEQPQQPQQGAEGVVPPTDINAQYEEFFNRSVDVLADQVYKFDETTAEELDTNPSKVLPKLAARLHMQVLTATMAQVANSFPAFMQVYRDRDEVEKASEEKFFGEYPHLKQHRETVSKVARVYHSMYPDEPYETRAPKIAAMAMVEAKVPMPNQMQPAASMRPPIPTSARGGTPAPAPVTQKNEWEDLVTDED